MEITSTPIRDKSNAFRVFFDKALTADGRPAPIDVVGLLEHVDDDVCEVTLTKGDLSNEVNIEIGLEAIRLGYKKLEFHRSMGGLATRWATLVRRADGMDYYHVDLEKAVKTYEMRGNS
ncbi:hypothetical protein [Kineobactrum salinum]|uniref:Uncharacterized protein n=1 Tax=Kineobactrum salinum TaxID=2708301 RepID=A0A6C0U5C7_9GAMM|nr:hypothetical protein [Kineobactrum salinum]QIB67186.1 hypothetical protein G3T16_19020 [Kineobactrum salinum]